VRAVDGTIVTISVNARVADDTDVPLLLGSSNLVANDVDLKLKQHLLSIGVYGSRRVDVRTCATQEESRRDSEIEMSQIPDMAYQISAGGRGQPPRGEYAHTGRTSDALVPRVKAYAGDQSKAPRVGGSRSSGAAGIFSGVYGHHARPKTCTLSRQILAASRRH
jgi:hypothetical protein